MATTAPSDAHDMSRFWRIFSYQGGRVNGAFVVHGGKDGAHHVKPYDVIIYVDEQHSFGRVLRSEDLTAFYRSGSVEFPPHMIRDAVRHDVDDAMSDIRAAVSACISAFEASDEKSAS